MGAGVAVKCKKCKFKATYHLGVGMMFPRVYERVVSEVKDGRYGEEWKQFFDDNTGAAIMCEQRLYQCPSCNNLIQNYDLSLYNHKNGEPPEHNYWAHWCDFDHEYELVKNYIHNCPKCGNEMHEWKYSEKDIACPKCGEALKVDTGIMWD